MRLTLALFCLSATVSFAGTITAPVQLSFNDGGISYSGLEFTALANATLTGFTFVNTGNADTVQLTAAPEYINPISGDTVAIGAGNSTAVVSGLSWALTQGTTYFLDDTVVGNDKYNETFGSPYYPVTDSDNLITVNTGLYNGQEFGKVWVNFSSLTVAAGSEAPGTPEPSTALLALGAGAALFGMRRRASAARA